jgi:hypothetical protein
MAHMRLTPLSGLSQHSGNGDHDVFNPEPLYGCATCISPSLAWWVLQDWVRVPPDERATAQAQHAQHAQHSQHTHSTHSTCSVHSTAITAVMHCLGYGTLLPRIHGGNLRRTSQETSQARTSQPADGRGAASMRTKQATLMK